MMDINAVEILGHTLTWIDGEYVIYKDSKIEYETDTRWRVEEYFANIAIRKVGEALEKKQPEEYLRDMITEIVSSKVKNINSRLGDLEAKEGKLSKNGAHELHNKISNLKAIVDNHVGSDFNHINTKVMVLERDRLKPTHYLTIHWNAYCGNEDEEHAFTHKIQAVTCPKCIEEMKRWKVI